jgi:hypothetical protein
VIGGDTGDIETTKASQKGVGKKASQSKVITKSPEEREQELNNDNQVTDAISKSTDLQGLIRTLKVKGVDMESALDDIKHYILQGLPPKKVVASINELYEAQEELRLIKKLINS